MNQASRESKKLNQKQSDIPFYRVVLSVIQASFGVQHPDNRARDFGSRSILPYVVAALLFTAFFITALVVIVKLALPG